MTQSEQIQGIESLISDIRTEAAGLAGMVWELQTAVAEEIGGAKTMDAVEAVKGRLDDLESCLGWLEFEIQNEQ
jgi:hypothetical protein